MWIQGKESDKKGRKPTRGALKVIAKDVGAPFYWENSKRQWQSGFRVILT